MFELLFGSIQICVILFCMCACMLYISKLVTCCLVGREGELDLPEAEKSFYWVNNETIKAGKAKVISKTPLNSNKL